MNSPIASKSSGTFKASHRTDWSSTGKLDARYRKHNAASSSQGWQKDAFLEVSTGKLVATEEDQEHMNFPEKIGMYRETCRSRIPRNSRRLRRLGKPKAMMKIGHNISIFHQIM